MGEPGSAIGSAFSLRNAGNLKGVKTKLEDIQTATHRFNSDARADLLRGPAELDSVAVTVENSAALPLGSALPRTNAAKLNENIQKSNKKAKISF